MKEITDRLEQGILGLYESDRYADYLRTMSKFHDYSLNNTIPVSYTHLRFMQKQQIKRQYAKAAKKGGTKAAAEATRKTAKKTAEETRKAAAFAARHPAGILIAVAALLLFIMISAGLSFCGAMFSGLTNGVLGTSYRCV